MLKVILMLYLIGGDRLMDLVVQEMVVAILS